MKTKILLSTIACFIIAMSHTLVLSARDAQWDPYAGFNNGTYDYKPDQYVFQSGSCNVHHIVHLPMTMVTTSIFSHSVYIPENLWTNPIHDCYVKTMFWAIKPMCDICFVGLGSYIEHIAWHMHESPRCDNFGLSLQRRGNADLRESLGLDP